MNKIIRRMVAAIISSLVLMFSVTSCSFFKFINGEADVPTTEEEFLSTFELDGDADTLEFEELYYDYGFFGDGMAKFEATVTDELKSQMEKWDELPLSEDANDFLIFLTDYITLPKIKTGNWMFVYREPKNDYSTNASLAVYDADNGVVYFVKCDT